MITIHFNSGTELEAYWAAEIRTGDGGVMIETGEAPFAQLAALIECASSMSWEDDEGKLHTAEYNRIKHMTRSPGRVQLIVDKGATA